MSRVGMHHVDIVVSSLERSLPLYRELLEPLGYTDCDEVAGERGASIWYLDGQGDRGRAQGVAVRSGLLRDVLP